MATTVQVDVVLPPHSPHEERYAEELRVQTFAPELKTAVPISPARLQDLWAKILRGNPDQG